jgi:transposase
MGLGPLICVECEVFAVREDHTDRCPCCGEENYLDYLWMFTDEQQERVHSNTRFYRFVAGQDTQWA